ncbi:MAG TPA: hypothetical protein VFH45_12145, partial [Acidimicrobiales bacterium]|nr:hypothetical protein [Acidimicrobiales bacterium]
ALDDAGLAWADVRPAPSAFDGPDAVGAWVEVDDRGGGSRRVTRSPYRFGGRPTLPPRGAPHRGEHNTEVLAQWLGLPPAEAERMTASGVLLGP